MNHFLAAAIASILGWFVLLLHPIARAQPAAPVSSAQPDSNVPLPRLIQECSYRMQIQQDAQALAPCQLALSILETSHPEHPAFLIVLHHVAKLSENLGLYQNAESLLRSLHTLESTLKADNTEIACILGHLAPLFFEHQGQYDKSEALLQRSLRIREKILGPFHPMVSDSLHKLGEIYEDLKQIDKAESYLRRSVQILEKTKGMEHPDVGRRLTCLAAFYKKLKRYSEAEALLQRGLRINEKAHGGGHASFANSLMSLASLHSQQGKYKDAEPLAIRSVKIVEKTLADSPRQLVYYLRGLAGIYAAQRQYTKAEPLYQRGLLLRERFYGLEHPRVAESLFDLAKLDIAQGQASRALPRLERAMAIRETQLRAVSTEAHLSVLLEELREEQDQIYSLALLPNAPDGAARLALTASLLRKGRAAQGGLITSWALHRNLTTDDQRRRFSRLQFMRAERDSRLLHEPADPETGSAQEELAELDRRINILEQELTREAPGLAAWKVPAPADVVRQVAARLPADSALIELLWIRPYQFQGDGTAWEEPRYVALILFPDARIATVDLGIADGIDQSTAQLLLALRTPASEPRPRAKLAYDKVLAPLLSELDDAQRIFLSPDGSLHLIPFAALHDGQKYLLDAPLRIHYVTAGLDLLRAAMGKPNQPPLILADPDYRQGDGPAQPSPSPESAAELRGLYNNLSGLPRLPGTRIEGEALRGLLGVEPLMGSAATESAIRQARAPLLLHIATHGIFLDETPAPQPDPSERALVPLGTADSFRQLLGRTRKHSLSRSALLLAGAEQANRQTDASRDGLLTAEEARGLNLFGTQLVVLSACDTGRGSIKSGQGVYGLRRAFFIAGAQTVITSLWPVSDAGTQGLMQKYYRYLLDQKLPRGRVSGLQEAMRDVKAKQPHPYYWAPFIAIGSDGVLDLARTTAK